MTQTQRCSFRMNLSIVLIEASLLAYIYIYRLHIYHKKTVSQIDTNKRNRF